VRFLSVVLLSVSFSDVVFFMGWLCPNARDRACPPNGVRGGFPKENGPPPAP
jgi:hypothetical protein